MLFIEYISDLFTNRSMSALSTQQLDAERIAAWKELVPVRDTTNVFLDAPSRVEGTDPAGPVLAAPSTNQENHMPGIPIN
jgi:hypothetical protein